MLFLRWIQDSSFASSIAASDSLWWGYPWWLFVHAVGMGLTAGLAFIICLRLLGVGRQIPISSFAILFRLFWFGFYANLLSGVLLFVTDATSIARVWEFYAKLVCLAIALLTMSRLQSFVQNHSDGTVVSRGISNTAIACIILWLAVITSGRLIAYAVEANSAIASIINHAYGL